MNAQVIQAQDPVARTIDVDDRFRITEHRVMRRSYFIAWRRGDSVPLGIFPTENWARHHCAELAEDMAA